MSNSLTIDQMDISFATQGRTTPSIREGQKRPKVAPTRLRRCSTRTLRTAVLKQ